MMKQGGGEIEKLEMENCQEIIEIVIDRILFIVCYQKYINIKYCYSIKYLNIKNT